MKTASKIALVVLFAVTGCSQLTAKSVAVATILATPAITVTGASLAIPDASIPNLPADAGFSFDAGGVVNTFNDAGFTVPPQNLAYLFFGQRQGDALDVAPVGVAGAKVTLTEVGGPTWDLTEASGGTYQLFGADAGFTYKELATYHFTVVESGVTYVSEIEKAPALERISQFHPANGYVDQPANQPFTFTRAEPASDVDLNLGFITVLPVKTNGSTLVPTYTNIPMAPLEFLKLVLAPQEYKKTSVTIPASAFPSANANYIMVFQAVKLGGPKTDNLFTGSAILAGTADVAVVKTR